MRTATVTLAGQEYTVEILPMLANAAWRRKAVATLGNALGDVPALVGRAQAMVQTSSDGKRVTGWSDIINDDGFVDAILSLLQQGGATLSGVEDAIEALLPLMFDYSPVLVADRERIEASAYDDEVFAAFAEVAKLAIPFGEQFKAAVRIANRLGRSTQQMPQS